MFLLILALAAVPVGSGQIMGGVAFEKFAQQPDRSCPSRQLRTITPGDLSWEQEGFDDQLSPKLKKRLSAASREAEHCAGRDGLSCPTSEVLDAMMRTNMLQSFSMFACSHPQP